MFDTPIRLLLDKATEVAAAEVLDLVRSDDLTAGYVALRRTIDRLEAEAQRRLAAIDQRVAYSEHGYTSPTAFVKHTTRTTGGKARQAVVAARGARHMPLATKLHEAGEIGPDQLRVLRYAYETQPDAYPEAEPMLCDLARQLEWVADLRRAVEYWSQAVAEPLAADGHYARRYLYASRTLDGMVKVDALSTQREARSCWTGCSPPRHQLPMAMPEPRPRDERTHSSISSTADQEASPAPGTGRTAPISKSTSPTEPSATSRPACQRPLQATSSPLEPSVAFPATLRSTGSSSDPTANPSRWDAGSACRRSHSAGPSWPGTGTANSPDATARIGGATSTMSTIGPTAARRTSTTSACTVAIIIASSTKAHGNPTDRREGQRERHARVTLHSEPEDRLGASGLCR